MKHRNGHPPAWFKKPGISASMGQVPLVQQVKFHDLTENGITVTVLNLGNVAGVALTADDCRRLADALHERADALGKVIITDQEPGA